MKVIPLGDPQFETRLRSGIDANGPGSKVISIRPLLGGISAQMLVIDLQEREGSFVTIVARQPGLHVNAKPGGVSAEFNLLVKLSRTKLPVPQPLIIEAEEDSHDQFYLMSHIDGKPDLNPDDVSSFIAQYAKILADVHRLDLDSNGLLDVRKLKNHWSPKAESTDHELREDEIRSQLEATILRDDGNPIVLRHGDLWPGNLLWKDGALIGVVDWENASLGNPLYDLSISRLDTLWVLGWEAMQQLTTEYFNLTGFDSTNLAYFDLVAALRPVNEICNFASAYPDLGRPDITPATLIRDHNRFSDSALKVIASRQTNY